MENVVELCTCNCLLLYLKNVRVFLGKLYPFLSAVVFVYTREQLVAVQSFSHVKCTWERLYYINIILYTAFSNSSQILLCDFLAGHVT